MEYAFAQSAVPEIEFATLKAVQELFDLLDLLGIIVIKFDWLLPIFIFDKVIVLAT